MAKVRKLDSVVRVTEAPGTPVDRGDARAPKTAGASAEAKDTSRSKVANRDPGGPRKAGLTPRPSDKPIVENGR